MVQVNNMPDVELPTRTRAGRSASRPSWWRRATAYGLNRLADSLQGTRRTPRGEGRALLRERRNLRLARRT